MGVTPKIAPSMLSSDFANLASEAHRMINYGADWLHMDIMVLSHYFLLLTIITNINLTIPLMITDFSHFVSFAGWVRCQCLDIATKIDLVLSLNFCFLIFFSLFLMLMILIYLLIHLVDFVSCNCNSS
jgi:hypothetical protein